MDKYREPEIEIIIFDNSDIFATGSASDGEIGGDEQPVLPFT